MISFNQRAPHFRIFLLFQVQPISLASYCYLGLAEHPPFVHCIIILSLLLIVATPMPTGSLPMYRHADKPLFIYQY